MADNYRALYEFNYMLWRLNIIERYKIRVLHRVILNEIDKEVERENKWKRCASVPGSNTHIRVVSGYTDKEKW